MDESGCGGVPFIPRRDTRAVASRRIVIGGKAKSGWVGCGTGAALAARERQRAVGVAVQVDVRPAALALVPGGQ